MKKTSAIIIFLLFAFYAIGGFMLFNVGQFINSQLVYSSTTITDVIKVPANQSLSFIKKNKEFKLDGELYDIISKSDSDGFVFYTVVHDKTEMHLLNLLKGFLSVNQNSNSSNSRSTNNVSFFSLNDFIKNQFEFKLFQPVATVIYIQNIFQLAEFFSKVLSPPPQLIS